MTPEGGPYRQPRDQEGERLRRDKAVCPQSDPITLHQVTSQPGRPQTKTRKNGIFSRPARLSSLSTAQHLPNWLSDPFPVPP